MHHQEPEDGQPPEGGRDDDSERQRGLKVNPGIRAQIQTMMQVENTVTLSSPYEQRVTSIGDPAGEPSLDANLLFTTVRIAKPQVPDRDQARPIATGAPQHAEERHPGPNAEAAEAQQPKRDDHDKDKHQNEGDQ
jgi:hypothetical protein